MATTPSEHKPFASIILATFFGVMGLVIAASVIGKAIGNLVPAAPVAVKAPAAAPAPPAAAPAAAPAAPNAPPAATPPAAKGTPASPPATTKGAPAAPK